MSKFAFPLAFLCLAGCNTPSSEFRSAYPETVVVDGSTFVVRVVGLKAEAIRTNMQYAPRLGPIGARASVAIEQVSGCKVARIRGDQAVVHGDLDCGEGAPAQSQRPWGLECYSVNGVGVTGNDFDDLVLDCDPVLRY